ncbi:glycosyltransferase family 2 protein [Cyclobacterium sp.]|uniref:glycosyltransferase family 2 protein n=1 Tax=Cyclobacterium sp. TaxID=1966343 RepID=UPI0019AD76E3|nr:glycosyltransferase family 2 protein [Cyclobacterium sp.]MBD3627914.1 glycosyltransferase family 2 protein [Cyclobacterium sp.]
MLEKESVSIIIPVFNREKLLADTLNSILNQTYMLWECILVDDGSQDDSLKVLHSYAARDGRFKVYQRPESWPKGAPSCRNFGFLKATGICIQFFDSDDIMLPEMLNEKVSFFKQNRDKDFIVSKMAEFKTLAKWVPPHYRCISENIVEDFLKYRIYFLTPGPLFKKDFLDKKSKLFDDQLNKHQEWEFYSRLLLSGCEYKVLDKVHCLRRMHDDSIKSILSTSQEVEAKNLKLKALTRLNRNTDNRYRSLMIKLFWKDYIRSIFLFLKYRKFEYFPTLNESLISFLK